MPGPRVVWPGTDLPSVTTLLLMLAFTKKGIVTAGVGRHHSGCLSRDGGCRHILLELLPELPPGRELLAALCSPAVLCFPCVSLWHHILALGHHMHLHTGPRSRTPGQDALTATHEACGAQETAGLSATSKFCKKRCRAALDLEQPSVAHTVDNMH